MIPINASVVVALACAGLAGSALAREPNYDEAKVGLYRLPDPLAFVPVHVEIK